MIMRLLILPLLLLFAGCTKKQTLKPPGTDFESLMGKDLPAWQYVQTKDDFQNLEFFKNVFEKNILFLSEKHAATRIPKVIHFIWIGPKPFPRDSIENVRSWIAHHPDWTFKFWTDRDRPLPHPKMERKLIQDFKFLELSRFFHDSDNFGEKSDLLRLEILFQEGGIYVDHDVKCMKPFDELNASFDLYCGMEVPYKTSLYSSVLPTNNVLGAKPAHLILKESMQWLKTHWDQIEKEYPGKDRDSVINRVAHRSFFVLSQVFLKWANQEGNRDIAFPSYYFNSPKEEWAIYSRHQYAGTWFEGESQFEKMVRERLMMLSKKTNKILLILGVLSALNLICFSLLFLYIRKGRRFLTIKDQ
ncbi:MAG TPA: glycosyltransferase [Rhabdochlamydiaceae bacterium]|nr:glycosyltransferase [Rhabdochlamydiaceae bacterium]